MVYVAILYISIGYVNSFPEVSQYTKSSDRM